MSSNANGPSQTPVKAQTPRPIRPNTWAAILVVLVIVVLIGSFLAFFRGHNTTAAAGTQPTAQATSTATAIVTAIPQAQVTKNDAEAFLASFLLACQNPATYSYAGQGVPCAKLARGRIPPLTSAPPPHYCVDDWHLVSAFEYDTKANLQHFAAQMSIDGVTLATTQMPIKPINATYAQHYLGGQYYYTQAGALLSPQRLGVGSHTLHQFAADGFNRALTFSVDATATGACA
ncbi:MAG: hypothetical protein H0X24_04755 [Ktedonobacterales bacterium]|nr:hypothetical protein [Ktedonobacterales bacterium]